MTYRVVWEIDIEAPDPLSAAREALAIHRDPESIATVFHVYGESHGYNLIDLGDVE